MRILMTNEQEINFFLGDGKFSVLCHCRVDYQVIASLPMTGQQFCRKITFSGLFQRKPTSLESVMSQSWTTFVLRSFRKLLQNSKNYVDEKKY